MPSELSEERKRIVMAPPKAAPNLFALGEFSEGGLIAKGLVLGTISLIACVIHGAYNYPKRGNVGTAPYILNYRVFAQGALVFTVAGAIGLEYVASEYRKRNKAKDETKDE